MKLIVTKYVYEPPALAIIPETEYEAAVLHRYWTFAELNVGKGQSESANGWRFPHCTGIPTDATRTDSVSSDVEPLDVPGGIKE